jgi:hypothetical protein
LVCINKASIDPSREKRSDGERVYIMSWVESVMKTSESQQKGRFLDSRVVLPGGSSVLN